MTAQPFLDDPRAIALPWVDSPFFSRQVESIEAAPGFADLARRFSRDGFLAVEGWIEEELIDAIMADSERFYDPRTVFDNLPPQVVRLLKQGLEQAHSCRVQDAWWVSDAVRTLACHPKVLELLRYLYQREPIPFQTLSFPVGSEQEIHADTIHFDSIPTSFMCGVWVALQDVGPDDGPLIYYPGSQRLPVVRLGNLGVMADTQSVAAGQAYDRFVEYIKAVIQANDFEEQRLVVPKGTLLIWSANLLHGGSRINTSGNSRHSQVTHYFFDGCAYYSPILSNSLVGELCLRSLWDIHRNCHVPQILNGEVLEVLDCNDGTQRLLSPRRSAGGPETTRPIAGD